MGASLKRPLETINWVGPGDGHQEFLIKAYKTMEGNEEQKF